MALPARKIEAESSMESRIARLETHTEHILSDVERLCRSVEVLREKLESKTDALNKKIDEKADELSRKIDSKANELNEKFDGKFGELQKALDSMRVGRVWDRVWMLLAMGALLGVMARGFKWI